jgi:hypothetical protein
LILNTAKKKRKEVDFKRTVGGLRGREDSVVKCLPYMHKAVGLVPSTAKIKQTNKQINK